MCGRFGTIQMLIPDSINEFNWKRTFLNINVNEKVDIFNSTILNILSNLIPHEFVVCNDKDPPQFIKEIRALIQEKNVAFKNYFKNYRNNSSNIDLKCHLKYLQTCLNASNELAKEKYNNTVNKLMNTQKNYKAYWSLLKITRNY